MIWGGFPIIFGGTPILIKISRAQESKEKVRRDFTHFPRSRKINLCDLFSSIVWVGFWNDFWWILYDFVAWVDLRIIHSKFTWLIFFAVHSPDKNHVFGQTWAQVKRMRWSWASVTSRIPGGRVEITEIQKSRVIETWLSNHLLLMFMIVMMIVMMATRTMMMMMMMMMMWMLLLLLHETFRCKSKVTQAYLILLVWFCFVVFCLRVRVVVCLCLLLCVLFCFVGCVLTCFVFCLCASVSVVCCSSSSSISLIIYLFNYFNAFFLACLLAFFLLFIPLFVRSFVFVFVSVKLLGSNFCMLGHGCLSMDGIIYIQ